MPAVRPESHKSAWPRDPRNNLATMSAVTFPVGRFSMSYAAIAAFVIEAALFFMLVYVLSHRTVVVQSVHADKVMLSFPVIAKPPPPKPQTKKPPPKPVVRHPHPIPKPIHHVVHHRHIPKPPPPKPVAKPTPVPPKTVTVPQPVPRKPSVSPDVMTLFDQEVHAAIQSALVYPYAAKMAHLSGRVRVSFAYRAGVVSDIRILQASPYAMFNTAAIQAVQSADYPAPPEKLGDRELQFELWVRFDQEDSDT